jgi:hypothetical protein
VRPARLDSGLAVTGNFDVLLNARGRPSASRDARGRYDSVKRFKLRVQLSTVAEGYGFSGQAFHARTLTPRFLHASPGEGEGYPFGEQSASLRVSRNRPAS